VAAVLLAEDLPLTADHAAELALAVAPEVAAARVGQAIAAAEVRAAYGFVYPHLSASASYTRASLDYQELPMLGRVAFNREDDWRAGVVLDQFLYTYDRLGSARDADRELTHVADQDLVLSRRDVAYAAKVAFEVVRLGRARVTIAQDRVTQRTGERDDAKAQVEVGRARSTDAQLAEIALAQASDERLAAESALVSARIRLAALIGVVADALPAVAAEPLPRPTLDTLLATASIHINDGGEAARLDLARRYEEATTRIMDSEDRPMLGLRATYGADGAEYNDLEDTWTAALSLTWNLYDGGGTIARTERMAQRSRQIAHQRDAVSRDRHTALDQARVEATSLASRITLAQQVVELATATYEDARAQYRAGRLTLTQVGDTSIRLGEARYRLLSLFYQEAVLGHDLEKLAE
ncbi:MAG TPA: TolC family protein, partial [Planctomycetota bacterium]|nr:TolC family protein [Planctomycetota bacterium]